MFALSTGFLSGGTQTINVTTVGQSGTTSAIFTGASSGSQAGWSVADAGDVNGVATSGGTNVDDLLIGAPSQGGGGAAYLVYGGSTLASLAQTVNGVRYINLANVGAASTTTGAVPGATILGPCVQPHRLLGQLGREFRRQHDQQRRPDRLAHVSRMAR